MDGWLDGSVGEWLDGWYGTLGELADPAMDN